MIGEKFHYVTVLSLAKNDKGRKFYNCECDCGHKWAVIGASLKSGNTKSCGCYKSERLIKNLTTHSRTRTPEHNCWQAMKQRCGNPKHPHFAAYGGRGIKVCNRWLAFDDFLADMGDRPTPKHSIERTDVNGNYEPSNCKWALQREQMRNTTYNHMITINGETQCLAAWIEQSPVSLSTYYRGKRKGLSDINALRLHSAS